MLSSLDTPRPFAALLEKSAVASGSFVSTSIGSACSDASSSPAKSALEDDASCASEEALSSARRGGASPPMTAQRLQCFKTKRCKFWQEGRCTRGDRCTYAHTEVELRVPPDLTKTKLCTRWKRGNCERSARDCAYAHGSEDLRDAAHKQAPADASTSAGSAKQMSIASMPPMAVPPMAVPPVAHLAPMSHGPMSASTQHSAASPSASLAASPSASAGSSPMGSALYNEPTSSPEKTCHATPATTGSAASLTNLTADSEYFLHQHHLPCEGYLTVFQLLRTLTDVYDD